ncbi:hypothetical protein BC937DRAFT_91797 [Endogone sp. FLAS-F59071]|nr:hypothetical protein BC937DRAFT_91797 [Endogone sp. FLAS-F59071]|eukprot:RUS15929.1 hypothetical protein BC937DRAFT_91797 [Endogone sp. FLAS-F59071]
MLLQLLPEQDLKDIIEKYEAPDPLTVLQLVAKYENRQLKDATVIIVVDGMQNIMTSYDDGMDQNSVFYTTLSNLGDLAISDSFLIPCCTATITRPVTESLRPSSRKRIWLPVNSLEPPTISQQPVFQMDDTLVKLLVSDCGGHGRALEILAEVIGTFDLRKCDVGDLMRELRDQLAGRYRDALALTIKEAGAIVRAILTHQQLDANLPIRDTDKRPDQIASPGLIQYVKDHGNSGYLTAPYIWIWMLAKNIGESIPNWRFDDYNEHMSKEDKALPPESLTWQNFEHFNARFRCLKSWVLDEGTYTTISKVHYGARLKGNIHFKNHHLRIDAASLQTDTRTYKGNANKWEVKCECGTFDVRKCKNCIINLASPKFADAFLGLDSTRHSCNEVHQYKYYNSATVSQRLYEEERNKAASSQDFFILFTTQKDCNINLPRYSGIVDGTCWNDYYGPFAGRAFIYSVDGPPNINTATRSTLQLAIPRR